MKVSPLHRQRNPVAGGAEAPSALTLEELARQLANFKSEAASQIARLRDRVAELEDDWDLAGDARPQRTSRCRRGQP